MPRKGENIYKRKDSRWEGRYIKDRNSDGKALYGYVYAKTYRETKNKLARAISTERVQEPIKSAVLFQDVAKEWFAMIQPQIKESTSVKYRNLLECYILPKLGEKPLDSISYDCIKAFCNEMTHRGGRKGTGLSPKTVSDILSLIRNILQHSSNSGNIPLCDARSIVIKQSNKEMRVLSSSEQERLYQYLYSNLNARNVGILICLFTGLRVGEICALRWEDISLPEQTIHVHQTMQRIQTYGDTGKKTKIIITTPKSKCSIRKIPLPDDLARIISELQHVSSGYFLTGCDKKYLEPRTMQNHFRKVLENCSVDSANFHSLRHTFATRCVELGFDVKSLSEILGHASVNITMNKYVHPSMEHKRENMQRLSSLLAVK